MSATGLIRLSHLIAIQRDLDKLANNVANVSTAGFKGQRSSFKEVLKQASVSYEHPSRNKNYSTVAASGATVNFSQGEIEHTGNATDVSIKGDGWFVVQTPEGNRYTRDGSFRVDRAGQLVSANGQPILTSSGPLTLTGNDLNFTIAADGTISTAQGPRGKILVVSFEQTGGLLPAGNNLFRSDQNPTPAASKAILAQGSLEKSNVAGAIEMINLVKLSRAYDLTAGMMQKAAASDNLQRLSDTLY